MTARVYLHRRFFPLTRIRKVTMAWEFCQEERTGLAVTVRDGAEAYLPGEAAEPRKSKKQVEAGHTCKVGCALAATTRLAQGVRTAGR